jgi:hypothetical protein
VRPPWPFLSRDRIGTEDGADLIEYTIEPDAVSRDVVEFVLTLGPDVTWEKHLVLWGPARPTLKLVAEGGNRSSSNVLPARQLHDRQRLTLDKAKGGFWFGDMASVYTLSNLNELSPGSRVTFQWLKD